MGLRVVEVVVVDDGDDDVAVVVIVAEAVELLTLNDLGGPTADSSAKLDLLPDVATGSCSDAVMLIETVLTFSSSLLADLKPSPDCATKCISCVKFKLFPPPVVDAPVKLA